MTAENQTPQRRSRAAVLAAAGLLVALAAAVVAAPAAADPRVRRNIDDLAPDELADYLHAMARLKEISRQNPSSKDGYTYLAELHNEFDVGPCEHMSDTFLSWHRAHLLEFEDALRRSDPPRTANVTVPYWDWSELPSGQRYAKAFEDPQSVLHARGRFTGRICRSPGEPDCQELPWPRSYLDAEVLSAAGWRGTGKRYFGGVSDDKVDCRPRRRTGYGAPEQPSHNDMHSNYIGGLMRSPDTAAEDPIFWSFHAYFDLLFDQWQGTTGHAVDTCLDCQLCGLLKKDGKPWTVTNALSTAALGYRYEYGPRVSPPVLGMAASVGGEEGEARFFPPLPAAGMALSGRLPADVLRTREIVVPETVEGPVVLRLDGVPRPATFSYNGDVYLYPKGEDFLPRDEVFRRRFLIDVYSIWQSHHDHGDGGESDETEIVIDLTDELALLSAARAGETWNLTVALVANTLGEEGRLEFAAAALEDDTTFAEAMSFDDMDVEGLP
jgi:hypothetical protein